MTRTDERFLTGVNSEGTRYLTKNRTISLTNIRANKYQLSPLAGGSPRQHLDAGGEALMSLGRSSLPRRRVFADFISPIADNLFFNDIQSRCLLRSLSAL